MQAHAAGYALITFTTPKQLVSRMVVGLTAAKFKALILPLHGFSLSNIKYNWFSMV
jgi:hypothetical protein